MKYFFLSEGWTYNRVWEFGGIWDENTWRRKPLIERLNIGIQEQEEILWLYQVENAVLMVEVKPTQTDSMYFNIGQVVIKRLISAEEAIEHLMSAQSIVRDRQ